ncbi:MAG: AmmeMemoRadiSam system protein A [Gammaproteobacteria bacterium]|uniref:AmmeMemoRadiSam system protein A n=1 Tax=Candidatus Thiopontia autotrophica TaxID=2841688 RepID=A0A8J6PBN0_9GAMM|nr:AmmeMemoRadiSam system protein A [Candidatus Thiopontia autotrophica]MBL6968608.1 AmmeMemoRadiSam system protein A [Gammaproteobacteria bacterium]
MNQTSKENRRIMLELAHSSIQYGVDHGRVSTVKLEELPPQLQELGACFVTLEIESQLRGCIGSLEAYQPLAEDLVKNSFAAAFQDPRFPPLGAEEFIRTAIKISLLTPASPINFKSEDDLIRQIRPGIDGLILSDRGYRGTFLPSVWEQLPSPELFVQHLKQKAGLPANYWTDTIKVERYQTELIT